MIKKMIETGKFVGTHGVRGGLRVQPWCDSPEFLCGLARLYFKNGDEMEQLTVRSSRPHGNIVIMELEGVTSIEQAERLRGRVLYLNREDLRLAEGQYLISDLLDCAVFDDMTGEALGKITEVSKTGANDVWHIERDGQEYLIPAIDEVVKQVEPENGRVTIHPIKGIFD